MQELGIKHVFLTGGVNTISPAVEDAVKALGITTERLAGPTRYDTSVVIADLSVNRFSFPPTRVDVANGESFPDALTGGAHAGHLRAPVLLTAPGSVPQPVCSYLQRRGAISNGVILGGPSSVSDSTKSALEACLRS
jgi:putative cell wall-binding protein